MAWLAVEGSDLVLRLGWREKVAGFHGDIRVPLSAVRSVRVRPDPWPALRGWRMAGIAIPRFVALGTRRHGEGYDFTAVRKRRPAVEVDVSSGRFDRLVMSVGEDEDAAVEADRIASAAGIAADSREAV